ncbi:MAG: hypothetical protein FWD72_04375, partial [Eggerthellaceae bacterium]|nr:hypothetical protein [Eggerthellaceae bacterium]
KAHEAELAVQVNGKVRAKVTVADGTPEEAVKEAALAAVAKHIEGKAVKKTVVVPGRLVSIVVG